MAVIMTFMEVLNFVITIGHDGFIPYSCNFMLHAHPPFLRCKIYMFSW